MLRNGDKKIEKASVFRMFACVVILATLSSCAVTEGGSEFFAFRCVKDTEERLDGINWDEAWPIDLRIRQGEFNPVVVSMVENTPVVLRIINGDDSRHTVRASGFFKSVALESIAIGASIEQNRCIDAVTIPARATAEIRLLPVRYGRYDFEDSAILITQFAVASAAGVFVIEPYKSHYIRPIPYTPTKATSAEPVVISPPADTSSDIFSNEPGMDEPTLVDEPTSSDPTSAAPPAKKKKKAEKAAKKDSNIVIFDDPEEFR